MASLDERDGETPEDGLRKSIRDMASDQVRRRANETMLSNAERDNRRFARILGPGESCTFCTMLASRGFVYKSASAADASHKWHRNCRCEIVPGFEGMEIEGYDPDELKDRWHLYQEIDADTSMPLEMREAAKRKLASMPATDESMRLAVERARADWYGDQVKRAWGKFRKNKTEENYQKTLGEAFAKIGKAAGIELSGEFMAWPDGNELWAATRIAKARAEMLYATREHKNPDMVADGMIIEIKTPESSGKLRKRLLDAAEKFEAYPGVPKRCVVSLLRFEGDMDELLGIVRDFLADGTLDSIVILNI